MFTLLNGIHQQTIQALHSSALQRENFSLEEGGVNIPIIQHHSELNSRVLRRRLRAAGHAEGHSCPGLRSSCLRNYPTPQILTQNRQQNVAAFVELRTISRQVNARELINHLPPRWVSELTREQIQLRLEGEATPILDSNFYNALSRKQVSALTNRQIAWVPNGVFRRLSPDFFNQLTHQLRSLRSEQIAAIRPEVFPNLNLHFWAQMTLLSNEDMRRIAEGFTPDQVSRIPGYIYRDLIIGHFFLELRLETLAAVPPTAFSTQTSRFVSQLRQNQVAAFTADQVAEFPAEAFRAFTPGQVRHLNPAVFSRVTATQLVTWGALQIQSITRAQLQSIPVATLQRLGDRESRRIFRSLSEVQRNALTQEQQAFFGISEESSEEEEVNPQNTPTPPTPSPTPPSGGANGDGNGGGGPHTGAGPGGNAGGARPKDPSVLEKIAKRWNIFHKQNRRKDSISWLPLDIIQKLPAEFWNDAAGPKPNFFWGGRLLPKPEDRREYEEMMRAFEPDQILAIPNKVLINVDQIFIKSLSPEVFQETSVVEKLFLNARQYPSDFYPNKEDLLGFKKEQIEKINFKDVSLSAIRKAFHVAGIALVNMLTPRQKDQFNAEKRAAIPQKVYGDLIKKLSQEISDQEIQQYAIHVSVAQYRVAMRAIAESITSNEGTLTDQELQAILKGTYRVRMEMNKDHVPIPTQTIVSSASNGGGGDTYSMETASTLETQIPPPPVLETTAISHAWL